MNCLRKNFMALSPLCSVRSYLDSIIQFAKQGRTALGQRSAEVQGGAILCPLCSALRNLSRTSLRSEKGRFCCKSCLKWLPNSDSVVLIRISAGACDDGAEQPGSGAAVLFIQSRRDRTGRPPGASHR